MIPDEIVREYAYRLHLLRLEPPLTPEKSRAATYYGDDGKVTHSDDLRRLRSASLLPLVRDTLRVLVDMGLMKP
jgi:hypothetical protein